MNKKGLTLSLLLIINLMVFMSCKNNLKQQNEKSRQDTGSAKTIRPHKVVSNLNCDTIVVSNEFGTKALAFDIFKADTNKVKSLFLDPVVLKIEKKKDSEGYVHDLYYFTDKTNRVILSENNDYFYIEDARIKNNNVLLNKKISIGMNKAYLVGLLNLKNIPCDSITVRDDEASFETVYVFKDSKLKQVEMGQIVE